MHLHPFCFEPFREMVSCCCMRRYQCALARTSAHLIGYSQESEAESFWHLNPDSCSHYPRRLGLASCSQGPSIIPRVLRYAFHDILDFNNMIRVDLDSHEELSPAKAVAWHMTNRDGDGNPATSKSGQVLMGGFDGCVHHTM